jgi:putative PIN family toxin of toxin-antitoxin system
MRVIVDTNILVSFAIRPNREFELLFDSIARAGVLLVSEDTIAELRGVLTRRRFRKYVSLESTMDYIDWYAGISELVEIGERLAVCRDPRDDKFLELAVAGRADFIVSGDADLLVLHPFREVAILRSAEFLASVVGGR